MTSLQLDVEYSQQPHWSIGYVKNRQGEVVATRDEANDWKHGGGGFKSNIADFARWAQALNAGKLLSHDMQRETWSVQSLADGTKTSWGLGFTVEDQNGLKVSHNGKQDEVTTRMVLYPQSRHGVVFMCNCGFGEVGAITTAVYKALSSK
jgi:CubicO group peptidase (beta-lactamase class C family)